MRLHNTGTRSRAKEWRIDNDCLERCEFSSAKRRDVKILKLNGKAPSYENIKTGHYVLYRPLYLVTKVGKRDNKGHDFIRFALSRDGQEIIRGQGTVPYSEAMALVMKQLDQYEEAVEKGLYR